jgi:RNA recognition motif-containing protein
MHDQERRSSKPTPSNANIHESNDNSFVNREETTTEETSVPRWCLFLGDLSVFCTEKDLMETFSVFGNVINIRIKRNKATFKNLSYGFVDYDNTDSALKAMETMNDQVYQGRKLR